MNKKQKHSVAMWLSDLIGSMFGGMIVTLFFGIAIYYGFGGQGVLCQ